MEGITLILSPLVTFAAAADADSDSIQLHRLKFSWVRWERYNKAKGLESKHNSMLTAT